MKRKINIFIIILLSVLAVISLIILLYFAKRLVPISEIVQVEESPKIEEEKKEYHFIDTSEVAHINLKLWQNGNYLTGYIIFYNRNGQMCGVSKKRWDARLSTLVKPRRFEPIWPPDFDRKLEIYAQSFDEYEGIGYAYKIKPIREDALGRRVYLRWEGLKKSTIVY